MVDPIISTGLAKDWLERLLKSWSTLRKTREDELQEIRNVFGDPKLLADYYIEPDCQPVNPADHDEDESIRAFRQPVRVWLNRFLEGEFFERDGRNTVFVLSDAGMGKTSLLMMLKLTHLTKFWPSGLDFRLMRLGPDTLERLAKIQNQTKTVLLLDSLDEDPTAWGRIEERLLEVLDVTKGFRQVILTCRTQFFPEGSAAPIEAPYKVVVGGYICNLLYLSPFDNAQVEAYLRNVYPNRWKDLLRKWWKKEDNPNLVMARKAVEPMKSLRLRPMLLAHIEELLQGEIQEWGEFAVYEALVRRWLLREQRKQRGKYTESQLWEVCEEVAIYLQGSGKRNLSLEDLETIRKTLPAAESLEAFDIGGRSLLNRTSDKEFRFSHYSIQEFLVARRLVSRKWKESVEALRATDQLVSFLFSWIKESPVDRLALISWCSLDFRDVRVAINMDFDFTREWHRQVSLDRNDQLRGVYLRAARLSGFLSHADLRGAWLEGSTITDLVLVGANLRDARLKGCSLRGVVLWGVDARGVDFQECSFADCDFSFGRFARAIFAGAKFRGGMFKGAGFLEAEGIDFRLDEAAGPPSPRVLRPVVLIGAGFPEEIMDSRFGAVAVEAGEEFIRRSMSPRCLAWFSGRGILYIGEEFALWKSDGLVVRRRPAWAEILSMNWDAKEREIFLTQRGGNVERWNLEDLRRVDLTANLGERLAVGIYERRGVLLASTSPEIGKVQIFDLRTREQVAEFKGYDISCLTWRPENPVLTFAVDRSVRLWDIDLKNQGRAGSLLEAPAPVTSLSWDSSGALLAATLKDGSVCVWDVAGEKEVRIRGEVSSFRAHLWALGRAKLCLLCRSGELEVWDVFANSRLRLPVQASEAAWHPSENLLALALRHGVVELWDINESVAKLHLSLFEDKPVQGLVVTADGYVDGPSDALQYVRFADGLALYDLEDLPERHDPERVRQAMAILSP